MLSKRTNNIFAIVLLLFILNCFHTKKLNNINNNDNRNILSQIVFKTSSNNNNNNNNQQIQSTELKRKIVNFINNIIPIGTKSICNNRLLQSDVQAEMKRLRSFLSTCSGYCRLAMSQDGIVYGAREFSLDAIWLKEDVSDESLLDNFDLLGSYYIKFISSNKYLCIYKNGQLYSSDYKNNQDCLWLNTWPKIFSAVHNLNLNLKNICNIDKNRRTNRKNFHSEYPDFDQQNGLCTDNVNMTTGYSPDLQKFFRNCQSILLRQSYSIPNYVDTYPNQFIQETTISTTTTTTTKKNILFKPIFNKFFDNKKTTTTTSRPTTTLLIEKLISQNINDLKYLCKDYIYDELIYKASFSSTQHPAEYYYETQQEKNSKKIIPKICSDLIAQLDDKKITYDLSSTSRHKTDNNNHIPNIQLSSSENNINDNNKFKKCFKYRNKPGYIECMNKYYKCYQYSNDIEKLKICRKANGITVATKIRDY